MCRFPFEERLVRCRVGWWLRVFHCRFVVEDVFVEGLKGVVFTYGSKGFFDYSVVRGDVFNGRRRVEVGVVCLIGGHSLVP